MHPRERFVHFVIQFVGSKADTMVGQLTISEAVRFTEAELSAEVTDADGDLRPPVTHRPLDAAWEFVQYRQTGANRPYWMPQDKKRQPRTK